MSYANVLVPLRLDGDAAGALGAALLVARRAGAVIEGFALNPPLAPALVGDYLPGDALAGYERHNAAQAGAARAGFVRFMEGHGVAPCPDAPATVESPLYRWHDRVNADAVFLGAHARLFDVTVLGRPDGAGHDIGTIETALFESGRPVLVAPPAAPSRLGDHAVIAWNGSTESARAVALAMPLLAAARRVTVLTVEGATVPGPDGDAVARHLRFSGIAADPVTRGLSGRGSGAAILAEAEAIGCDLLVKGAYTQSRLRQLIFGGATSHLLAHVTMPMLIAH